MGNFGVVLESIFDLCIVYLLALNLGGFNTVEGVKKLRLVPTLVTVALFILLTSSIIFIFSPFLYTILFPFIMLGCMMLFIDKKNMSLTFDEVIIMWLIYHTISISVFVLLSMFLRQFTNDVLLIRHGMSILSLVIVVLICQWIDFNRLLIYTLKRLVMRFVVFTVAFLFFIFSVTADDVYDVTGHGLLLFIFLIPIVVGVIYTARRIHENTRIIPEAYHDAKKLLMLLDIKAEEAACFDELNGMIKESVQLMDLQGLLEVEDPSDADLCHLKRLIKHTLTSLKKEQKSNVEILTKVHATGRFERVNEMKLAYMLSLLMEFPLGTLTKYPIYVKVVSTPKTASIRMSCHYKFQRNLAHFEKFLVNSDLVQSEIDKHFSLSKLRTLVADNKGEIYMNKIDDLHPKVDYLSVCLVFNQEDDEDVE